MAADHLNRRQIVSTVIAGAAVAAASRVGFAQSEDQASPAAGDTRTFEHAMGVAEIPANPQRVIVLDGPILDAAMAVGVIPVGATTGIADAPWPDYLGPDTSGITNVGTIEEPNLESIVALQPDLILGSVVRNEGIYPQLAEIAPTVISDTLARDWREGFSFFTDALNQSEPAGAVVATYEGRLEEVRSALGDQLPETIVSVIRVLGPDVRSYNINSFSGTILGDIGLPRPDVQQAPEDSWTAISLEEIGAIDGTAIFVTLWGESDSLDGLESLATSPLWESLQAVQTNRVYRVPDEYWMTGIGYLAAERVLDDIVTYLVEGAEPAQLPG